MKPVSETSNELYFLSGGGEMGELVRSYDWSATSIGTPDQWPQSLRTTIGIILHSSFPMFLFWGEDLICFYNDAFKPSLGTNGKHPAIGKEGKEVWSEIWDFIGPMLEQVKSSAQAVWFEDQLVPFYRNGKIEDIYWTFSYSPAYGNNGEVEGVFVTCTETTGKVQTVKRLEASEKRFQSLIRDTNLGIVVLMGEDNVVEIVNNAYAALIDRTIDELLHKSLFTIIPETKEEFKPIIDNVRITGESLHLYDHPYFLVIDGRKREGFLNLVYQPYREDDGKISGVMIQCQDVTEQVFARKKVVESEQRVRTLVESAPFPIGVYVGREMRIELANQSILDVWGKGNDVIGKLYSEVLPELDNQQIFEQLDTVYTTGIPFHARNQRVDLVIDGRLRAHYFNYSFTPLFDTAGKVYGVMNTAAETTDLNLAIQMVEQSQTNFRNMILQAPVAMCIMLGPDYVVEVANKLMLELWGRRKSEVINRPVFEGLPDAKEQGLEGSLKHVYETGETFTANEMKISLLRNGKREDVYQNFVYEPYRNSDGSILGIVAISLDVSAQVIARRKIEQIVRERTEELESANNNLQKSNAELAQFAYIASHDLQEPLRKISIFAKMLQNKIGPSLDEQSDQYVNKIKSSATRMNNLIKDVLTYSALAKDKEVFSRVDLNEIVNNILTDYELMIEQKGALIHCDTLPHIDAIPLQMSQLFGNLISNSLKFSRNDIIPVISISSTSLSKEEKKNSTLDQSYDYCRIQVKDNGIGFKPEYAEQIFSIFQRLHGKLEYEGTGIGLAICKKIALNHQGDLNAEGSREGGAVFNVTLPCYRPN